MIDIVQKNIDSNLSKPIKKPVIIVTEDNYIES